MNCSYPNAQNQAWAILLGDRWFCRVSKKRVLTAWSLAGARLFMPGDYQAIQKAQTNLFRAGRQFTMVKVACVDWTKTAYDPIKRKDI